MLSILNILWILWKITVVSVIRFKDAFFFLKSSDLVWAHLSAVGSVVSWRLQVISVPKCLCTPVLIAV